MRDARATDWLRRLRTRQGNWLTRLERFALVGVPSIGTVEISIQSPLTVLSGPNGVGKTTLLRALWATLEPEAATQLILGTKKLSAGTVIVDLVNAGVAETAEVTFSGSEIRVNSRTTANVYHIDSAAQTPLHQRAFCLFESSEEIVNGAGQRELDPQMLSEVSYILHRSYRSMTLYETELDEPTPFFEVAYGDDRYDSRTMGAGEMSALYIWWALNRAEANSIVLIEEPEAFLSYGCQQSLARFLVSNIVQKHLVVIISSHSSAFISAFPRECLIFLSRGQAGVTIVADQPPPVLLKAMGIDPPVIAIIFVEDPLAQLFCRFILEKFDAHLSRQVFIDQRDGDGEIKIALKPMLKVKGPIKFVGLFDGDLRAIISEEFKSRSAFLPGNKPVETVFRDMVNETPNRLAESVNHPHIMTVIASLEGKDHHDWYKELAMELGISKDQLFLALFSIWIKVPENEEAAIKTYNAISALVEA